MNSRTLPLARVVSLGCLPLAFRGSVHADVRGAHSLTAIVGAQGLTRDTNGDGLADMVAARVIVPASPTPRSTTAIPKPASRTAAAGSAWAAAAIQLAKAAAGRAQARVASR
jgi:hypothetical protein